MFLRGQDPTGPYSNSHFMLVDSVRIHYREWNENLAHAKGNILLVHGFCGSTFCWRENADTLAKSGYRVVAIDLPGFGYSSRDLQNQSNSNRARILWDLLDAIGPGDSAQWNITGHSMGGGVAEAMALMEPSRTQSLVLVDGMIFIRNQDMKGAFVTTAGMRGIHELYVSIFETNIITQKAIRRLLRNVYGFVPDTSVINGYYRPLLRAGTAESIIGMFAYSKEIESLNAADLEKIPVCVIWGKKDRTIQLGTGKKLIKAVPSAELKIIPKAYHSPNETHPSEFNTILLDFLDRNNR